jgi:hypothetical protein
LPLLVSKGSYEDQDQDIKAIKQPDMIYKGVHRAAPVINQQITKNNEQDKSNLNTIKTRGNGSLENRYNKSSNANSANSKYYFIICNRISHLYQITCHIKVHLKAIST